MRGGRGGVPPHHPAAHAARLTYTPARCYARTRCVTPRKVRGALKGALRSRAADSRTTATRTCRRTRRPGKAAGFHVIAEMHSPDKEVPSTSHLPTVHKVATTIDRISADGSLNLVMGRGATGDGDVRRRTARARLALRIRAAADRLRDAGAAMRRGTWLARCLARVIARAGGEHRARWSPCARRFRCVDARVCQGVPDGCRPRVRPATTCGASWMSVPRPRRLRAYLPITRALDDVVRAPTA